LEKRIYIPLPDASGRQHLLKINLKSVKLHEDVNIEQLASKLDGYSGADITNVCRDASFMSMRKRINGLSSEEIRQLNVSEMDLPVKMDDFLEAVSRINSSVNSKDDVKKYDTWMQEFGSK
jgi:katanin p60 ATPase-containing subunit A1